MTPGGSGSWDEAGVGEQVDSLISCHTTTCDHRGGN